MTKVTYKRKKLNGDPWFWKIRVRDHREGEHGGREAGTRATAESICLKATSRRQRERHESFDTTQLILSDRPLTRPHFLLLPKEFL